MKRKLNILICPLGWGMGHAARMIPIAGILRAMDHNVLIAGSEEHLELFRKEMPGLQCIHFSGFSPAYSRHLPQYLPLLMQTPALLFHIVREHTILKKLISQYSVDLVISDNRFGLWNRNVTTVYVTHMPRIPLPQPFRFLEFIGIRLHKYIIRKYNYCYIPDLPGEINLSGRLSHGLKLPDNVRFIGILSRFPVSNSSLSEIRFPLRHNALILSGPEPQRSLFRDAAIEILRKEKIPAIILEGRPGCVKDSGSLENFEIYDHLTTIDMQAAVSTADIVIARAGYSTIMDLVSLNRSAVLVPTPGQTEQEYLARHLASKGWFGHVRQKEIGNGNYSPRFAALFPTDMREQSRTLLNKALEELLD